MLSKKWQNYLKYPRDVFWVKKGLGTPGPNVTPPLRRAPLHLTTRQSPVNLPFQAHSPSSLDGVPGHLESVSPKWNSSLLPTGFGLHGYRALPLGMPSSECYHQPPTPSTDKLGLGWGWGQWSLNSLQGQGRFTGGGDPWAGARLTKEKVHFILFLF